MLFPFLRCHRQVIVHVKDLEKLKKVKVCINRSSTLPQQTLPLKRLVGRPGSLIP